MRIVLIIIISFVLSCKQADTERFELTLGDAVEQALQGGELHSYRIELQEGEQLTVAVYQRGIDVLAAAYDTKRNLIQEFDSPTGCVGIELMQITANKAGKYRIEVKSLNPSAKAGRYRIKVVSKLTAQQTKYRNMFLDEGALENYYGVFSFPDSNYIALAPSEEQGEEFLTYFDSRKSATGKLYPATDSSFFAVTSEINKQNVVATLRVKKNADGMPSSIQWQQDSTTFQLKAMFDYERRLLQWKNKDVLINGVLFVPLNKKNNGTIVLIHDHDNTSHHWGVLQTWLLLHGWAVLSFDKRGTGESTGDWRLTSFEQMSDDVLQGIETLTTYTDINTSNIGLLGTGEGAWVAVMAAAQSSKVRFLVAQSGSVYNLIETTLLHKRAMMLDAGFSDSSFQQSKSIFEQILQQAANGISAGNINELIEGEDIAEFALPAGLPATNTIWQWWSNNGTFDVKQYLAKVKCPSLWLWGEKDLYNNCSYNDSIVKNAVKQAQTVVIQKANRNMIQTNTGLQCDIIEQPTLISTEYLNTLHDWLQQQTQKQQ